MIKALIFDWGRTLYDPTAGELYPQVGSTIELLSKKYTLAIVSLASDGDIEKRISLVRQFSLEKYFRSIQFTQTDKDSLYQKTIHDLNFSTQEICVVDDRVKRGIKWGNANGAMTVWIRQGKFADELPDNDTGKPSYTIRSIEELLALL